MLPLSGLYKHNITGIIYKFKGIGKLVTDPTKKMIIYESLSVSTLRETNEILHIGTIWIRDYTDFVEKFSKKCDANVDTMHHMHTNSVIINPSHYTDG